jgi:hypothetical protein
MTENPAHGDAIVPHARFKGEYFNYTSMAQSVLHLLDNQRRGCYIQALGGPAAMKSPRLLITACFLFSLLAFSTTAQTDKIIAANAKDHVGETRTVCGKVVSTHYASGSKGQPTFLNLDEPYPKEVFTILIWGSDRAKFGTPETKYKDAKVCVTGKITSHREKPEIMATEPGQIAEQKQ